MSKKEQEKEQEKSLVTKEEFSLESIIGNPISDDEYIQRLEVIRDNPDIGNIITKLPDKVKAKQLAIYFQDAYMMLKAGDKWAPSRINLVRKMNPKEPKFLVGTFRVGDKAEPSAEVSLIPVVYYPTKVYWPPYNDQKKGEQRYSICSSVNCIQGIYKKTFQSDPEIICCKNGGKECPFSKDGYDANGNPTKEWSKALCSVQHNFLCVTPEFDGLYEIVMKGFDTRYKYLAHQKFRTYGKLYEKVNIDIEGVDSDSLDIVKYSPKNINAWLKLTGEAIENDNEEIVSAATRVVQTSNTLGTLEMAYSYLYSIWASKYIQFLLQGHDRRVKSVSDKGVIDVETSTETVEESDGTAYSGMEDEA